MNVFDSEWTQDLNDDLEKLIELSAPEIQPSEKIKLTYGERRQVTVLFLDMKGFTALSEKFDHEIINNLIDKMFMVFKNHIDRRDGWVEKFEGDAILAAFGSKIAHEDDAVRAIDAAMAIMESLHNLKPQLQKRGIEIDIRIGVHSGEVTRSKRAEFDVIVGDTVNTAARLEQNALPGTILVSEPTQWLAGDYFRFEDHPPIYAKGKSEPVKALVVVGKQFPKDRWNRRQLQSGLVGRNTHIEQLTRLYTDLNLQENLTRQDSSNQHIIVSVEGDPGIGKSRLIHEFIKSVPAVSILKSAAPAFASKPFESITILLSSFLNPNPAVPFDNARLEERIAEFVSFAADPIEFSSGTPLLGFLLGLKYDDPRIQKLEPKNLRMAIFIAVRTAIEAFAQKIFKDVKSPALLVFEDYHWMDEPSREFIPFLVSTAKTQRPFFIAITCRPPVKLTPFAAHKAHRVEIKLEPLSDVDSCNMIRNLLGGMPIPEFYLEMVQTRGAGNPYYIEELINHWIDQGVLFQSEGHWRIRQTDLMREIPLTLHNLLAARLDHLDSELKMLLQHASVFGREFILRLIEWVESRLESELHPTSALDDLISLMFLIGSDSSYMFRHILTRDVAYNSLLISNRKILHKLCALAIEAIHQDHIEDFLIPLGEHWLVCGETLTALDYFIRAANHAKRLYDNKNAIDAFTKALELMTEESEAMISLFLGRGEVLRLVGRIQDALNDFESSLKLAENCNNQKMMGHSLNSIGNIQFVLGHPDDAYKFYERALAIRNQCGDELGQATSIHNMGNIHHAQGRLPEALANFRKALAIRESHADPKGIAESSNNIGILHLLRGEYGPANDCFSRSLKTMHDLGDRVAESNAILNIGRIHFVQGNHQEARNCFEQTLRIKREIGDLHGESLSLNNLGAIHYLKGRFNESLEYYQQSLKLRQALNDKPGIAGSIHNIGTSYYCLGAYSEALIHFQKSLGLYREIGNRKGEAESLNNIGLIHYEDGRYRSAAEYFRQTLDLQTKIDDRKGTSDSLVNTGKVEYALHRYQQALDHYSQAIRIKKELNEVQGAALASIMYGDVRYCMGYIDEAMQLYTQSLETFENLNDKKWKAITLSNKGRIEAFRGNYPAALTFFEESLSLRKEIGDARGEAYACNAIGTVFFRMNDFSTARENIKNSLNLKQKLNDRQGLGYSMHLLGDIAYCETDYKQAISCYEEALKYRLETDQDHMKCLTQSMMARMHCQLKDFDKAFDLSRQAVDWLERFGPDQLSHVMEPEQLHFTHFLILKNQENPQARMRLDTVYRHMETRRRMIGDQGFFENVLREPLIQPIQECFKRNNLDMTS